MYFLLDLLLRNFRQLFCSTENDGFRFSTGNSFSPCSLLVTKQQVTSTVRNPIFTNIFWKFENHRSPCYSRVFWSSAAVNLSKITLRIDSEWFKIDPNNFAVDFCDFLYMIPFIGTDTPFQMLKEGDSVPTSNTFCTITSSSEGVWSCRRVQNKAET